VLRLDAVRPPCLTPLVAAISIVAALRLARAGSLDPVAVSPSAEDDAFALHDAFVDTASRTRLERLEARFRALPERDPRRGRLRAYLYPRGDCGISYHRSWRPARCGRNPLARECT